MAEQIEGNIWVELDRLSREHLSKSALLAQSAQIQDEQFVLQSEIAAAEKELDRQHEKNVQALEVSRVLYDQKYTTLQTKKSELNKKVNESEVNKLAFSMLKGKDSSDTDATAFSIVDAYKSNSIDAIDTEIKNLNNEIITIQTQMDSLNDEITKVNLGSEQLKSLALMVEPSEGYYTPDDISSLITEIPNIDGKQITSTDLSNAISEYGNKTLSPDNIGLYDFTKDGVLDKNDALYFNALTDLTEQFPDDSTKVGNDALDVLSDLTFTTSGLETLNKSLRTEQLLSGSSKMLTYNLTKTTEARDKAYGGIMNVLIDVDEDGATSINSNLRIMYNQHLGEQGLNTTSLREKPLADFENVINYLSSARDGQDMLERLEEMSMSQPSIIEFLKSKIPSLGKSVYDLSRFTDELNALEGNTQEVRYEQNESDGLSEIDRILGL